MDEGLKGTLGALRTIARDVVLIAVLCLGLAGLSVMIAELSV